MAKKSKNFLSKLLDKIDNKLEDKSKQKKCCCKKSKDKKC
jgi:hypothetical protein